MIACEQSIISYIRKCTVHNESNANLNLIRMHQQKT